MVLICMQEAIIKNLMLGSRAPGYAAMEKKCIKKKRSKEREREREKEVKNKGMVPR
jgi:hypothetical protein